MGKKRILVLASFCLYAFVFAQQINAQIPDKYVPCSQTVTPEFHSLRPYQASPCNINIEDIDYAGEEAVICGNDLIARDTFSTKYGYHTRCVPDPNTCPGVTNCEFHIPRDFWVSVNPYESRYPIAGNTELIPPGETTLISRIFEQEHRLEDWKANIPLLGQDMRPPDPEDSYYNDSLYAYWRDYQRWRGKSCFPPDLVWVPWIKKYFSICLDNPFKANFWSNVFPYIPYSSTEDRIGKLVADEILQVLSSQTDIWDLDTIWKDKEESRSPDSKNWESELYFPHMEENVELVNLLQSTYLSQEFLEEEQKIDKELIKPFTYTNENRCIIANVRSNPGDQLFGQEIVAEHVTYTAHFWCEFPVINTCPSSGCCPEVVGTCTKSNVFYSDIEIHVPLLEELWSKTVAGNASFLKKLYPKIGEDPFKEIEDVPGVSEVVHSAGKHRNNPKTIPGSVRVTIESMPAEMYFPHLGGIYDYFLEGVQTLLRPKGYESQPLGLSPDQPIEDTNAVNEYVSWYLNGTIYRAEKDYLDADDKEDQYKIINLSGPLNKLLPQSIQWRATVVQPGKDEYLGRVAQIERAGKDNKAGRHNQIVACTAGLKLFDFEILGIPVACSEKNIASTSLVPSPGGTPDPSTGNLICPYTSIPSLNNSNNCILIVNQINGIDIPAIMKKVFEAAGSKFGVPPDLIAGVMFAEGGFEQRVANPNCYGEYTEENIKQAILCEFPNCNPDEYSPPCNYDSTQGPGSCINGGTHFGPYQQCPNGYNPCNFYDSTMHMAESLSKYKYGMPDQYFIDRQETSSCLGIEYNKGQITGGGTCSTWSCSDMVTAIRFNAGSCITDYFQHALQFISSCP